AHENRAAARRIADTRRIERTSHEELIDVGMTREVDRVRRTANVGLEAARIVAVRLLEERHCDVARAGLQGHTNREPLVYLVSCRRRVVARCRDILVAAE